MGRPRKIVVPEQQVGDFPNVREATASENSGDLAGLRLLLAGSVLGGLLASGRPWPSTDAVIRVTYEYVDALLEKK